MNLTSPSEVRTLLDSLGVSPNKVLGQNFLIDRNILDILVQAADVNGEDVVLEIGPGLGVVTARLLEKARRVIAVEKDTRLHAHLQKSLASAPNLELHGADMLELDTEALLASGVTKVVSNLPYSVGTRILVNLITAKSLPSRIVVTVQQEVADRLAAAAGGREFGAISVWTGVDYRVSQVKSVSPNCFWPRPEVGSAIVRLVRRELSLLPEPGCKALLMELTRHAFTYRRKKFTTSQARPDAPTPGGAAALRQALQALGLSVDVRPEQLDLEDWCRLATYLYHETGRKRV